MGRLTYLFGRHNSPKACAAKLPVSKRNMHTFIKKKIHNLISDQRFSEILTGSAWALTGRVIATLLGFLFSVLVARLYGAETVGIVAVINSFLILVTILTLMGTQTSILRLIPEHLTKYSVTSAFRVYRKTENMVIGISLILLFCIGLSFRGFQVYHVVKHSGCSGAPTN